MWLIILFKDIIRPLLSLSCISIFQTVELITGFFFKFIRICFSKKLIIYFSLLRPLYLPARVFLSIGSMNLSSNIVAHTSTSLLRFVVEDAALYLSNRVSYGTINLYRDYVSVLSEFLFVLEFLLVPSLIPFLFRY